MQQKYNFARAHGTSYLMPLLKVIYHDYSKIAKYLLFTYYINNDMICFMKVYFALVKKKIGAHITDQDCLSY